MLEVMAALESVASLEFEAVIAGAPGRAYSRALVVATFLAILELTRLAAIRIYQGLSERGMPEGPIHLRRSVEPGDTTWMQRIAELM